MVPSPAAPSLAWLLADLAIGIMTLINLPVLCSMSGEVKSQTELFLRKMGIGQHYCASEKMEGKIMKISENKSK